MTVSCICWCALSVWFMSIKLVEYWCSILTILVTPIFLIQYIYIKYIGGNNPIKCIIRKCFGIEGNDTLTPALTEA